MSIYGELNPIAEHRIHETFDGTREHMVKSSMPNMAYPSQPIDIEIPKGSRNHVIMPDTLKITFNLEIKSTDKTCSVVNNVGRALVKKKKLTLGSTEIDTINNSDIYDTYKDLFLSKKEREERLLQDIQPANGLKARVGAKKTNGTALTLTTQENAIKKTLDKRFAIPLDFDFFKHPVYPYGLEQSPFIRIELNSAKNALFCTGDTNATYKLSDISLEYDVILDGPYATVIGEMYVKKLICYTKVTSIHHQTLSKKDTTWKIDVNNLSVRSLQGLLLLFLDKSDDFANKNEEYYNPNINNISVMINGIFLELYRLRLQARDIYPELKKYFYKENSDVTWKGFLTTKFALWIDTRLSTNNTLPGSGRAVEKTGTLLQIEKAPEASGDDLTCHVFSLEDTMARLNVTDLSGILTIEK